MDRPILMVETYLEADHAAGLDDRLGDRRIVRLPTPGREALPGRVDGWVDHHHATLDALGIEPPYTMIGWSFGGVVALELTRRLRDEGRPVEYLAMLDSIRPWLRPLRWRDAIPYHLTEAALISDLDRRREYLNAQAKMMVHRQLRRTPVLPRLFPSLRNTATGPKREKPTDPLVRAIHKSYLNYGADPVDFPVSLFVTTPSVDRCDGDVSLRWAPYLRAGYQAIPVAGSHHGMWQGRALDTVVAALERDLERAANERRAANEIVAVNRCAAPRRG